MKRICIVCSRYPNALTPTRHVFVQKLVWAWAQMGVQCTVIAPVPVNQYLTSHKALAESAVEDLPDGSQVKVFYPRYISAGQRRIAGFSTSRLTAANFHRAVRKTIAEHGLAFDAVYGHFMVPAGITAARIGRELSIPSFAAFGEASPSDLHVYGIDRLRAELATLRGVVSVSTHNTNRFNDLDLVPSAQVETFPNGTQRSRFYPRDKAEARRKFGVPMNAFHVAFVGQFTERKGVLRVADALNGLDGISVAFAGRGEQVPKCGNVTHMGPVAPEEVPEFLSAADAFVMPTLNEGCCNAIVEAVACGLPVISSNLPFNWDVLDESNSILVDPTSVDAIRAAVIRLKENDNLRQRLAAGALAKASELTIERRAERIHDWMRAVA